MNKFLIPALVFSFGTLHSVQAQIYSSPNSNPRLIQMMHHSLVIEKDAYINVYGNPFVDRDFKNGEIVLKDSSQVRNVPMRLNTYTDNIEFKNNDSIMIFSQPDIIDHVTFGHRSFIYSRYKEGAIYKNGYFEVLAWGKCKLLLHRGSIIKREQLPASNFEGGNFRDYFRLAETCYIKKDDKPATKISKTKKSILKTLGDHRDELQKYIKKNQLGLSKENALIDLIYYYNSLDNN